MENKISIKSAGLIDGEWKVIFSNDTELYPVQAIEIDKSIDRFGEMTIRVLLPDHKERFNKNNK